MQYPAFHLGNTFEPTNAFDTTNSALLNLLFKTSRDLILIIAFNNAGQPCQILDANDIACQKLGYTRTELLQCLPADIIGKDNDSVLSHLMSLLISERAFLEEVVLASKTASKILCEVNLHLLEVGNQNIALLIGRDITNHIEMEKAWRKSITELQVSLTKQNQTLLKMNRELQMAILELAKTEQVLSEKENQLRLVTENMHDFIFQIDTAGLIQNTTPSCTLALGYSRSTFKGTPFGNWIHPADISTSDKLTQKLTATKGIVRNKCRLKHSSGKWLWIELTAKSYFSTDNQLNGIIISCRDITYHKRMEKQLQFQAEHDCITKLYNRTYFETKFSQLSGPENLPIALITCDLDGLKYINDTLGHQSGDTLLIAASILLKRTGKNAVIGRMGGDEFAVLLTKTNQNKLDQIRNHLIASIDVYNQSHPQVPLFLSIGSAYAETREAVPTLFREADNSMHRQKLFSNQSSRSSVVNALKKALEARDFVTEGHAARLKDLMVELADYCGIADYHLADLRLFAEFHDIGKVGIPDAILFKPGPLTAQEQIIMESHSEIGHRIARSAPDLEPIADLILHHHEWWNGEGYPTKLKGLEIPLECRILSIIDAYDAMTNDRPYRKALSEQQALTEIVLCAGKQFDPELVEQFMNLLSAKKEVIR